MASVQSVLATRKFLRLIMSAELRDQSRGNNV